MVNDRTTNLDLPLPHADNSLDVDVGRLRTAVDGLDSAVSGKSAIGHGHAIADVSGLQGTLDSKQAYLGFTPVNVTAVGAAGGVAPLDGTGKVASTHLPSYVDDVLEYANFAALPGTGETGKIYVLVTPYTAGGITSSQFRWSGSAYSAIVASPGTTDAVTEGSTNKYFTESRVLATLLAGLSTATNLAIAAGDSILGAMGKLQKQITDLIATVGTKQAALVSGTNIKTVNSATLLGSGDLAVQATLTSGTNIKTVFGSSLLGSGDLAPFIPITQIAAAVTRALAGSFNSLEGAGSQAAATNYLLHSNELDNGVFGTASCSISPNVAMGPDGEMTADKYIASNGATVSWSGQTYTGRPIGAYAFKRKIKDDGGGSACLYFYSVEHGDNIVNFNTTTGVVLSSTGPVGRTPNASYLGGGWWEFSIAFTITGATSFQGGLRHAGWTGDGTKGFLVGHGQLEDGLVATSDIKTTSAAVTRSAGVVAPQRVLLPSPPSSGDYVGVKACNGSSSNIIDPDGYAIEDSTGPMLIDRPTDRAAGLRFINNAWRFV